MTPLAVVTEYYARIDANDYDWVTALFAEDACYVRADATYTGRAKIDRFFRDERKIRGSHDIKDIHAVGNEVVCKGEFNGVGARGDERSVRFVDLWYFQADGQVRLRETYLALGHEYVRE